MKMQNIHVNKNKKIKKKKTNLSKIKLKMEFGLKQVLKHQGSVGWPHFRPGRVCEFKSPWVCWAILVLLIVD